MAFTGTIAGDPFKDFFDGFSLLLVFLSLFLVPLSLFLIFLSRSLVSVVISGRRNWEEQN